MLKSNLKYQNAIDSLVGMILREGLKPGDPILSENRLATLFGVSRVTVRQALAKLSDQGVLKTENGRGSFLLKIPEERLSTPSTSGLIGFICNGGLEDEFMASVASGVEAGVRDAGLQLCVGSVVDGPAQEADIVRSFLKRGVDGIIISPVESNPPSQLFLELCRDKVKMAVVDELMPGVEIPSVACDDLEGGFMATERLIKAGHRRIAHVCGPRLVRNSLDRFEGYRRALARHGVAFDPALAMFDDEWEGKPGEKAARRLLDLPPGRRPTAIFASNDLLALEVCEVLNEKGLSVPEDVSLVGYGNLRAPYERGVFLASVDQRPKSIGYDAWLLLRRLLDGDASANSARMTLKPKFVERRSVAKIETTEIPL